MSTPARPNAACAVVRVLLSVLVMLCILIPTASAAPVRTAGAPTMALREPDPQAPTGPLRPADGTFVATIGQGRVYQIVGGAPIYVESWANVGGVKPYSWVDPEIISEAGVTPWWNARTRSGLLSAPADGTFVATIGEGRVYQFVGGAPIYVESWAAVGGERPYTWISRAVIAGAGTGLWSKINKVPANGTLVATVGQGRVYQIIGGAPMYLDSWTHLSGVQPLTWISPAVVNGAGSAPWSDLRRTPADGTPVTSSYGSDKYMFVGGAAVFVATWQFNPPGGWGPTVSSTMIASAGEGPWSMLRKHPKDGTFVETGGKIYRFAGGQPFYVDSWAPHGGVQPYSSHPTAGYSSPQPDPYRSGPIDGTFVATTDGRVYRYAGGAPFHVTDWAPFGGPQPYTVVSSGAVDFAGQPGPWQVLPRIPADGTMVREAGPGYTNSYVMVGGAPIYVDDWSAWGGPQPAVAVSGQVLRAPQWGPWSNIRRSPLDGTVAEADGRFYSFHGGRMVLETRSWSGAAKLPTGLPAGAGTGPWASILPPI